MRVDYYRANDMEIYLNDGIFYFAWHGILDGSNFHLPYQYALEAYEQLNGNLKGVIGDFTNVTRFTTGSLRVSYSQKLSNNWKDGYETVPIALIIGNQIQATFLNLSVRASRTAKQTKVVQSLKEAFTFIETFQDKSQALVN